MLILMKCRLCSISSVSSLFFIVCVYLTMNKIFNCATNACYQRNRYIWRVASVKLALHFLRKLIILRTRSSLIRVHFVCFYEKISLVSFIEDIRDQDQIAPLGAVWSRLTRDKLVRWPILHTVWALIRQLPKEQSFEYIRNKQTASK